MRAIIKGIDHSKILNHLLTLTSFKTFILLWNIKMIFRADCLCNESEWWPPQLSRQTFIKKIKSVPHTSYCTALEDFEHSAQVIWITFMILLWCFFGVWSPSTLIIWNRTAQTFIKPSSFAFHGRKYEIQIWNDKRMSKLLFGERSLKSADTKKKIVWIYNNSHYCCTSRNSSWTIYFCIIRVQN